MIGGNEAARLSDLRLLLRLKDRAVRARNRNCVLSKGCAAGQNENKRNRTPAAELDFGSEANHAVSNYETLFAAVPTVKQNQPPLPALGDGKLKVQLALVYEYQSGAGPAANVGDASGEATIENDTAVFVPEEAGDCKITMTFLPNGKLKVEQQGEECGFGHNVRADGTFRKISSKKPKFDDASRACWNTMK
jgi:hypothetical protein